MSDNVNHPAHYTFSAVEVIDAIEAWGLPYHLGNVVKYVARARHKNNELEDLRKARWYLERYIAQIEEHTEEPVVVVRARQVAEATAQLEFDFSDCEPNTGAPR